jgi:putative lipoprotein
MIPRRLVMLALLPLFAGCQSLSLPWAGDTPPQRPTERLQGELSRVDGNLQLRTCLGQRQLQVVDPSASGIREDAQLLLAGGAGPLFGDLRGSLVTTASGTEQLEVSRVYRLQSEGRGCAEADFRELLLRASGNEPGWSVRVTGHGMLLERTGEPPLALPYLEEQLPGGQASFSSEADLQRIELWVAPQYCVDSASGAVSHLGAELRVNGQKHKGCAYFGGARND